MGRPTILIGDLLSKRSGFGDGLGLTVDEAREFVTGGGRRQRPARDPREMCLAYGLRLEVVRRPVIYNGLCPGCRLRA